MTDRVIRWGILGTARIATKVGKAIHEARGAELTAIASRSAEKAEAWAAEHGAGKTLNSYEALLDDAEIDAVYIPLPPSLHREWTIKAAEHGKHVLCEKPLALTHAETEEMVAACGQHGVQLMDGVMWYHHPRANEMRQPIQDGTLGELRRFTSAFTFCWPWLESYADLTPDQIPEGEFRLARGMGGGSLYDLGWYCVGAALWAFGDEPERVFATARWRDEVDLNCSGMLWFSDHRMASFDCGFDTGMRRWMEVAGSKGSLICDDFTRPWDESKPRFWLHNSTGKAGEFVSSEIIQEVAMIEDMGEIIRSGELNPHWPAIASRTQKICEALEKSARTDQVIEIPAD